MAAQARLSGQSATFGPQNALIRVRNVDARRRKGVVRKTGGSIRSVKPQPQRPDLAAELLSRGEEDQRIRTLPENERGDDYLDRWRAIDADNTAALKRIIDGHGWPGVALVGKEAAHVAWLLAQHADADPVFQQRALDLLTDAVSADDASPADLAYLTDRCRVAQARPQLYGTQFHSDANGLRPCPIEDPDHLDNRRATAGLGPFAEYEAQMRELYPDA